LNEAGSDLPAIAREAIERWLATGERADAHEVRAPEAPVFVTLRETDGRLRGCVGSLRPVLRDVAAETARVAVLAATEDPRFTPVTPSELDSLRIEVTVLMPEETVAGVRDLDPDRYGVVVRDAAGRQGVLLPDIEGIDDGRTQLRLVCAKAGIPPDAGVTLSRFEVRKFREPDAH
jgi:AmmeMemoRadiSam system protein A